MFRGFFLLLPLASGCLIPIVEGNGNGGLFGFGYTEEDYADDVADVGCDYVMQCFDAFASFEECEQNILVENEPCPNFIPEQARTCIDDIEEATATCANIVATEESACANVCG